MPIDPSIALQAQPPQFMSPAQMISLRNMQRQGQIQELQLAETQRQVQQRNRMLQLMSQPGAVNQATGMPSSQAIGQAYSIDPSAAAGMAQQRLTTLAALSRQQMQQADFAQKKAAAGKEIGRSVVQAYDQKLTETGGNTAEAVKAAQQEQNRLIDEMKADGRWRTLGFDDTFEQKARTDINSPQVIDQMRAHFFTPQEIKGETAPQSALGKLEADRKAGRISEADYQKAKARATSPTQMMILGGAGGMTGAGAAKGESPYPGIPAGGVGGMSPDAIHNAAVRYNQFGETPPVGFGTLGFMQRAAIMNESARLLKDQGMSAESAAVQQKANKAVATALSGVERQRGLILTFENTANRNADIVLDMNKKVDRTGVPAFNRWVLAGRQSITGDPDVAKLNLAIQTFTNEYARVTNSATGGGVSSDTARKEISDRIYAAQTPQQLEGVISLAKQEMANRRKAYEDETRDMRERMGQTKAAPAETDIKSAVEKSGWSYEPDKYEYRVSPEGKVQRRVKGG